MSLLAATCILAIIALCFSRNLPVPNPPVFPDVYEVEYTFSLPYVKATQGGDLRQPVHLWFNASSGTSRIDYYGGVDSTLSTPDAVYVKTVRINESICYGYDYTDGPTFHDTPWSSQNKKHSLLPDLSTWTYGGKVHLKDQEVLVYKMQRKIQERTDTYTFYVTEDGSPVAFHTLGAELFANAHIDEYLYEFTYFNASFDPSVFEPPSNCSFDAAQSQFNGLPGVVHQSSVKEHVYQLWAVQHDKVAASEEEYQGSMKTFSQTADMIHANNAANNSRFRMDLNPYSDVQHDQFLKQMLPMKMKKEAYATDEEFLKAKKEIFGFKSLGVMTKTMSKKALPKNVDWRGTGAVGASKDQATCGSCWAFAAAGALEGAWFLATGQQVAFSEQQLVDCSWEYAGSMGCDGGWYEGAIQYVAENGGAVPEEDYQYLGQNGYCVDGNRTKVGKFKGFLEVPSRDVDALKEALYKYGPVAVSVDAEWPTFRYYSEGLYVEKRCKGSPRYLDHAVLLVGYGTDKDGQEYWLIKNSWAKFFGDDGYMRIPVWHDCGVTTDPVVAVVADEFVQPGVREEIQKQAVAEEQAAEIVVS